MTTHKFPIGTTYSTRGRYPDHCTVTDQLSTYNSKGELVGIHYVATHEFHGQILTDRRVNETRIAMGSPVIPPADGSARDGELT